MIRPDETQLHETTSEEEKRHREAALDETLEGTMDASDAPSTIPDPAADFYIDALRKLQDTGIPFLVGGAFAFSYFSRVPRDTKDIDVFVRPDDCPRVLEAFRALGYETSTPFPPGPK